MAAKSLLDHFGLADDHLLQFLLHQPALLAEFLKDISETAGFGRCGGHEAVDSRQYAVGSKQ